MVAGIVSDDDGPLFSRFFPLFFEISSPTTKIDLKNLPRLIEEEETKKLGPVSYLGVAGGERSAPEKVRRRNCRGEREGFRGGEERERFPV
jgi:hypothetical protein